ncbi:hypothetical protein [Mycobacteroides abscessus]|uniref:hypothetical protein n=1 Tax=Mycobacteroides abscessus TaxID=36809 RepID=UPI001056863C|nr:hypothetical protein [Mycobacteroides abscessus]
MKPVIALLLGAVGGLLFWVALVMAVLSELGPYLAAFALIVVVIAVVAAVCVSQSGQPGAQPYWERPAANSHSSHSGHSHHHGPYAAHAQPAPLNPRVGYPQGPALSPPALPVVHEGEHAQQMPAVAHGFRQRRHGSRFVARLEVGQ